MSLNRPVRGEYLRIGTPVVSIFEGRGSRGVVIDPEVRNERVTVAWTWPYQAIGTPFVIDLALQSGDSTARAHAAWGIDKMAKSRDLDLWDRFRARTAGRAHLVTLSYASRGHEPPPDQLEAFVVRFQAALLWAEGVVGGN